MKKQILFAATALMLTAGVVAGSNESEAKAPKKIAINKKNFPDQVFRELVKFNYDKNKDKKLSRARLRKQRSLVHPVPKTRLRLRSPSMESIPKSILRTLRTLRESRN
mgnify:CR=1 FL=1